MTFKLFLIPEFIRLRNSRQVLVLESMKFLVREKEINLL